MSTIDTPKGFFFSTASAGIKHKGRDDMALIYSETEASAAALFTTNKVKGAPVKLSLKKMLSGKARAIIVNSGNSNVATGAQGMRDAEEMTKAVAGYMGVPSGTVHVSSTGTIGVPMPMERIRPALRNLVVDLGSGGPLDAAQAIMTTDTFPKVISKQIKLGGKACAILGICKGAGMIAPNMATLLAFILTDAAIEQKALRKALTSAVNSSFNRITIDGDRSTSDTAFIMANGLAGNKPVKEASKDFALFSKTLSWIAYEMSRMIVADGEGATKLVEIFIKGANTDKDAELAATAVANSFLVKTAFFGQDPNWGRIIAAIGYSGAEIREEKTDISFGSVRLLKRGVPTGLEDEALKVLSESEIRVDVNLNLGKGSASVLTCDISEEYVRINAAYRT